MAEKAISGIYALTDDAGVICYIGQSRNIARRFRQHCSLSNNTKTRRNVCAWCVDLILAGRAPGILILEETESLDERERFWIKRHGLDNLLNMNEGGAWDARKVRASARMPWHPHQAPLQRALISIRRTANDLGSPRLRAAADLLQQRNRRLQRDVEDWVVANLAFVCANPSRKTWPNYIQVGDGIYG
jgi:hypothetical protein